ncbi:DUF3997 domain-containing protein [Puteibacter caeruleilacunae]|nr:DUF3997 domain-containing protein [Puteibacter caeruleilacunae]
MRHYIIALTCLFFFNSCHQFVYKKHLMKDYYLLAVDSKYDMSVALELKDKTAYIGRIDETVFEVGFDDRFIIAKQYPEGQKDMIRYFILDSNKDTELAEVEASVFGPLTETDFLEKRKSLGISEELKFTINLKEMFNSKAKN